MNHSTIDGRFAEQVRRTPERIALEGTAHAAPLTYLELDRCANRLAAALARHGVTQGAPVLLMLPRCSNAVIAMLAIVKLGAIFVPLDPNYPAAVKHAYARDSAARHAIAAAGDDTLRESGLSVIHVAHLANDGSADDAEDADAPPPAASHGGDAPAYVMFTSGSTGKPKGVVVPHRGVVRLVDRPNYIAIQPDDAFLLLSPITFDASTFEIWGALLNGARLVVYDGAIFDPNAVSQLIREQRVSVMWLTAALFHLVVRRYPAMLTGVRVLLAGGDVLHPDAVNAALDAFPDITVVNGYGPTENTTFTCCHVMTRDNRPDGVVPIGTPVTGTSVHVVRGDGDLASVPDGQEGELYAGGDGVALGYLNQPDATRAAFVPDPSGPGRLYRTGDIVRRRADGALEFVGRRDRLTKIRGYRVSLDEVQQLVARLPCVEECVVQVREDPNGEKLLVATVQTNEQRDNMPAFIRGELRKLVPGFMIPDAIAVCAELPVNANGKVDRVRLASPI
ncbi:amino acid adenylation domain-containing protein [Burkholderia ambifaria]|uniref:amino acid adenylation domain-containing protein n=1 Tax=Burkholderia ambifaria TaxID=152480 RepID=UPI00158891FF|nr:amino acid adenylation domain-containing protein [Burkholderia ambifaria]